MKPEEFTRALRDRVEKDLKRKIDVLRTALTTRGALSVPKLQQLLKDPGEQLAKVGLISHGAIAQANEVVLAIYMNSTIHQYMKAATKALQDDREFTDTMKKLSSSPDSVSQDDLRAAVQKVIENDSVFTGPLRILLSDKDIRKALRVPDAVTFDSFIQGVRKAVRDARTIDEAFANGGREFTGGNPIAFCTATICVGVVSIVTLLAVVHTVIGAVNYLFVYAVAANKAVVKWEVAVTVGGLERGPDWGAGAVGSAGLPLGSACTNETDDHVWIAVETPSGFKRLPLPPRSNSLDIGIPEVRAVLIGGRHNPVAALRTPRDGVRTDGAYILSTRDGQKGRIAIRRGADGELMAEPDETQMAAEHDGVAGYSDLEGNGTAGSGFDPRFRLASLASLFPPKMDYAELRNESLLAQHFYDTLRMAQAAQTFADQTRPTLH